MSNELEAKFKEKWPEFFRDVTCGFWLPDKWDSLVWVNTSFLAGSLTFITLAVVAGKLHGTDRV